MAMLHRALFTWFLMLIFLIFLPLRLDGRTDWNWFFVFIPMWLYDAILLIYIVIYIFKKCKGPSTYRLQSQTMRLKIVLHRLWDLAAVLLKIAFLTLLCYKLQFGAPFMPWYIVFVPLFFLMLGLTVDVFNCLLLQYRDEF